MYNMPLIRPLSLHRWLLVLLFGACGGPQNPGPAQDASKVVLELGPVAMAPRTSGAVTGFEVQNKVTSLDIKLVGGVGAHDNKVGRVFFDVPKELRSKEPVWDARMRISAEVRVGKGFVEDWSRPAVVRFVLQDTSGKLQWLAGERGLASAVSGADTEGVGSASAVAAGGTSAVVPSAGSSSAGPTTAESISAAPSVSEPRWLTLEGQPYVSLPIPLGGTEPGFNPRDVKAVGLEFMAGNRESKVLEGKVEVRHLRVTMDKRPKLSPLLAPKETWEAEEKKRAEVGAARLKERLGESWAERMTLGANLPWPAIKLKGGKLTQLYGRTLDGGKPWFGELWDVGNKRVERAVLRDFRAISRAFGANAPVRVFLFADGRAGLNFDENGMPAGFSERAKTNMEKLLKLAKRGRVTLVPVLFDFMLADGKRREGPKGAWRVGEFPQLITNATARSKLAELVTAFIAPLAGNTSVLAWEVMNEPCNAKAVVTPAHFADLQRFLKEMTAAIHAAGEVATVGYRNPIDAERFMRRVVPVDIAQVHYWPPLEQERMQGVGLGKKLSAFFGPLPTFWGELAAMPGRIEQDLSDAQAGGAAAALFWSWRDDDETGGGFELRSRLKEIKKAKRSLAKANNAKR